MSSRSQLLVYGAAAVALLLLGARWIRSADAQSSSGGGVSYSSDSSGGNPTGSGSFGVQAEGGQDVVVDVAGAVVKPGVYRLPAGSRVNDAIERAGGATAKAESEAINLAARLSDGQQVVLPSKVESSARLGASSDSGTVATNAAGPISLGTATVDQLDTIEGIGPVTAQHILDYRDEHGGFSSIDELDQVPGIGPATMEALRARLQP